MNQESLTQEGKIVYINRSKGYGFIKPAGAENKEDNIFFHASGIIDYEFTILQEGYSVEYFVEETTKGIRASDVVVV